MAAVIIGVTFPAFSLFFGEVLKVFQLPANEVLGAIHMWAALFIALAVLIGVCNVVKV